MFFSIFWRKIIGIDWNFDDTKFLYFLTIFIHGNDGSIYREWDLCLAFLYKRLFYPSLKTWKNKCNDLIWSNKSEQNKTKPKMDLSFEVPSKWFSWNTQSEIEQSKASNQICDILFNRVILDELVRSMTLSASQFMLLLFGHIDFYKYILRKFNWQHIDEPIFKYTLLYLYDKKK